MHPILELARRRPVVFDGAMGTEVSARGLSPADYGGHDGVGEVLVETRPDVIADVHRAYLEAGADVIETDTFGANAIVLSEHGLAGRAYALNVAAASLARRVADAASAPGRPRFVAGSVGPGSRLPSLGQVSFRDMHQAYREQVSGLLAGGVDAILVETCQDPLQARAACIAAADAMDEAGQRVPIFCQYTFDPGGRTLLGTDPAAAVAAVATLRDVAVVGTNCSTGPDAMAPVVRALVDASPLPVSAQPNAGLPERDGGRLVYRLTPVDFAEQVAAFAGAGAAFVGGCCGTTPAHIAALVRALDGRPAWRRTGTTPAVGVSSLFSAVSLVQEPRPLIIGERTNANGSKEFRERLLAGDLEGMVGVAAGQAAEGAHLLDVSVAVPGRDEATDLASFIARVRGAVDLPLACDSTSPKAIEAALEAWPGRAVVNSVNLEDGGERLDRIARVARRHGAAIVALTIDESGMAMTAGAKVALARRLVALLVDRYGFAPGDCLIDVLTFTLASGDPGLRGSAVETIEAIRRVKAEIPGVLTSLGVSNVSFGLKPPLRRVLNSVFLHRCIEAGLDAAIMNAGKVLPLGQIPEHLRSLADDLVLARREAALEAFIAAFDQAETRFEAAAAVAGGGVVPAGERVRRRVLGGDRAGLEADLEAALAEHTAAGVVNDLLLPAMREVGEAFSRGDTQLPFVLRSAEVVKAAVAWLRPRLGGAAATARGTVVLATVAGDVHDVGKNLVDVILSNNGWRVVNLGVKQPVDAVLEAAAREGADAIGLSGLLVRSTEVMREDVLEMRRRGVRVPVLLGGAALNAHFVEAIDEAGGGPVFYCRDAFEGLAVMERIASGPGAAPARPAQVAPTAHSTTPIIVAPPRAPGRGPAPFLGTRAERLPVDDVACRIDRVSLFRGQWRFRKGKMDREAWERQAAETLEPILRERLARYAGEGVLEPAAVWGFVRAEASGDRVVLRGDDGQELHLSFPRVGGRSFADAVDRGPDAALGVLAVTVGPGASERARALFEAGNFEEYLYLHGISVEMAEAAADLVHERVREAWGLASGRRRRGRRVSFGYPGCPPLDAHPGFLSLVGAGRIGLSVTESFQLVPEQSVTAIIFRT